MPLVGAYEVTREYGGPEEGGWWYDHHDHIESLYYQTEAEKEALKKELKERYGDREWGRLWSVNGGLVITCLTEEVAGEHQTRGKPRYE